MGSCLPSHLPSRRPGQQPEWGLWCKLMENGTWLPHRGSSPPTAVCAPPVSPASDARGSRGGPGLAAFDRGACPLARGPVFRPSRQAHLFSCPPVTVTSPRSRAGVERGAGVLASAPSASPSLEFDQIQIALCSERRAFLGI